MPSVAPLTRCRRAAAAAAAQQRRSTHLVLKILAPRSTLPGGASAKDAMAQSGEQGLRGCVHSAARARTSNAPPASAHARALRAPRCTRAGIGRTSARTRARCGWQAHCLTPSELGAKGVVLPPPVGVGGCPSLLDHPVLRPGWVGGWPSAGAPSGPGREKRQAAASTLCVAAPCHRVGCKQLLHCLGRAATP